MRVDRLGFLIGFLVILYVCISFVVIKISDGSWFPDEFNAALSSVVDCTKEKNPVACVRPAVKQLVEIESGAEVMDELGRLLTPQQCHYVGHVVGQESYSKYQNVENAISQCNRACDSACIHGVIGEAFAIQLGLGSSDDAQDVDLKHLSPDDIRKVGQRLCESPTACHGVGHALFQTYGKFEPALSMCREVATEWRPNFCYQGVFMEYADILSARNARPVPGVEYPTPETIVSLCDYANLGEKRACFRYFSRIVVETLQKNGYPSKDARSRLLEICTSFPQLDNRVACIAGFGVFSAYNILTDLPEAVRACQQFSYSADKVACSLGLVSVATEERQEKAAAYCAALPDVSLQASCYQAVFFYLNRLGIPMQKSEPLCKSDSICLQESKNFKLDSWEQVKKRYAP